MEQETKCYCGHTTYCDCGPLEEPKQEKLEEAAENYGWRIKKNTFSDRVKANELAESAKQDFISGAKWQAENMFSKEEVDLLVNQLINKFTDWSGSYVYKDKLIEMYEQFKKK
jgi:hypothetical protein